MKNTTVSVPDEVDRAARIRAAERGRSVGTLVADHLQSLAESEAVSSRLKAQQKRVQGEVRRFSARARLDRDALHDRAVR